MQRGDGRILISFYKGVHSHTDASDVPEEPSLDAFPEIGSQASSTNMSCDSTLMTGSGSASTCQTLSMFRV